MMLKKRARNRQKKIGLKKLEKKIEAEFVRKYFPKGDRINRKLYMKKIEDSPSFKKELKNMRNILYGNQKKSKKK